jgi:hypothetical protein
VIDASDTAIRGHFNLERFVRDPEILKLQYRNNLIAVSFKCTPEMYGFVFFQVDYKTSILQVSKPLLVKDFHGGNTEILDSGLYVTNSPITDISISPDMKNFTVLKDSILDYYVVRNEN